MRVDAGAVGTSKMKENLVRIFDGWIQYIPKGLPALLHAYQTRYAAATAAAACIPGRQG
jgi:hypothetical protein